VLVVVDSMASSFLHSFVVLTHTSSSKVGFAKIYTIECRRSKQARKGLDSWRCMMHLAPIAIVVDRSQRPAI
jgi:hypothetical protein